MWRFTDSKKTAVFRIDELNRYHYFPVDADEIQDWIASGNVPLEPFPDKDLSPALSIEERLEAAEIIIGLLLEGA